MNFEKGLNKKIEVPIENIESINKKLSQEIILRSEEFLKKFSLFVENTQDELGINLDDLRKEGFLGQGGAGSVFSINEDICFKHMKNRLNDDNFNDYDYEALSAKNINGLITENVKTPYFFAYYRTESSRKILMERIHGVDLQYVLNGNSKLPKPFIDRYIKDGMFEKDEFHDDLWEFIESMHERGVVHNDLAARNIMIDEMGKIVVIDTGRSKIFNESNEDKIKLEDKDYNDSIQISDELEKYFFKKNQIKEEVMVNIHEVELNKKKENIEVEIFDEKILELVKEYLGTHQNCGLCEVKNNLYVSPKKEDLLFGLKSLKYGDDIYYIGFKND